MILNWRDSRSPRAGGAELLTHEVATRLVARGHDVTWFTSRPNGLPSDEEIAGIRIVRRGSELTTRLFAPAFARRGAFDVVVEQINTLPYFTPLWATVPTVVHFNQLAREVWWYEAPKPLAAIGYACEPLYLQAYRRASIITISHSTAADLRRLGLGGRIDVVPMAVNVAPVAALAPKRLEGHLLAIGRLAPSKRYGHAIEALEILRRSHSEATLTIVGDGPERDRLRSDADRRGLGDAVKLVGRVDDGAKTDLLTRADVLIGTSVREGWGLTVTEAALRGTPAVVYDVAGFRDSVIDGRTGLLTAPTPAALAAAVRRCLEDADLYGRLRGAAFDLAAVAGWEKTALAFETAIRVTADR